jgi:hypothetical protein
MKHAMSSMKRRSRAGLPLGVHSPPLARSRCSIHPRSDSRRRAGAVQLASSIDACENRGETEISSFPLVECLGSHRIEWFFYFFKSQKYCTSSYVLCVISAVSSNIFTVNKILMLVHVFLL